MLYLRDTPKQSDFKMLKLVGRQRHTRRNTNKNELAQNALNGIHSCSQSKNH